MAGGSGTRLWPMSRKATPKQLHKFYGEKSLLEETYERIREVVPKENIYVSLVKKVLKDSQAQLKEIPESNFIIEPEIKNTAPAIGLVAAQLFTINPEAIITTIASDHTIGNVATFQAGLRKTFGFVEKKPDYFVTIGIKPTRPDTGFGYIKVGKKIKNSSFFEAEEFVEKPDIKTAKKYLESGKYLWNASYFTWRADKLLAMYKEFSPKIYENLAQIIKLIGSNATQAEIDKTYALMPTEPIDTAIAEKVKAIAVLPLALEWSDIGSWASLYELLSRRKKSHTISQGNHLGLDNKNCLIYAQDRLLATVGLKDIVIVDTPDVTLVCNRNKSQDVKKLIEKIKTDGKIEYL